MRSTMRRSRASSSKPARWWRRDALGGERVLVDGAIDRVAIVATGNDAVIVATGMSRAPTIEAVAAHTRRLIEKLGRARTIACTTCPVGEGRRVEPEALLRAVGEATGLPVFDLQAGLRWNR